MAFWHTLSQLVRSRPGTTLKNQKRDKLLINRRIKIMVAVTLILTILLLSRLVYLQIIQHYYYQTQAHQNQINVKPIAPKRGLIYDRHGHILAKNKPVYNLVVNPDKTHNLQHELNYLQQLIHISPSELQTFHQQLKLHRRFDNIQLKLQLNRVQVATITAHHHQLPGFHVKAQLLRYYPYGKNLAHIIGYVGRLNQQDLQSVKRSNYSDTHYIGKTGIEAYYEKLLHGQTGHKQVETDASGQVVRTLHVTPAKPGADIYLTIDTRLQLAAQKALQPYHGAVVAIQPDTGQILAMASSPSFNPNRFVHGMSYKYYSHLVHHSGRALYNRNIHGLYAMGSTVKPFIALQGLNTGTITPDYTINDHGWFKIPGTKHVFHDWLRSGHGRVDLKKAITVSCDTYFYNLAYHLGIKHIDQILRDFGFGQKTGVDLPHELSGTVPSPKYKRQHLGKPWYKGDTINTGIGQGYSLATPLQLAYATTIVANRGRRIKPTLMYGYQPAHRPWLATPANSKSKLHLKKSKYWQDVIQAMGNVIPHGTGHRYGHPSYSIAAKTGTAQVVSHRDKTKAHGDISNSIFIAFAPIKHPRIAVAAVVEHQPGASVTVARHVIDAYLKPKKNHST